MKKMTNEKIDESMLQAYVDNELSHEDIQRVEAYLHTNPEALDYVESLHQQGRLLKQAFDPVLEEEIPDFLLETVKNERKPRTVWLPGYKVASLVLPLVFGGLIGWFMKPVAGIENGPMVEPMHFVKQAQLAHVMYAPEKLHPVDVSSDQEKHLVSWISKRIGTEINAPNLSGKGYSLVGGRLLPNETGPSAQFMYENEQGQRLTLYVNKNYNREETAFEFFEDKDVYSFYWVDKSLVYALTGNLKRNQLLDISHHIYRFYNKEGGELKVSTKI